MNFVISKAEHIQSVLPEDGDWEPVVFFHYERGNERHLEVMPIPVSFFGTGNTMDTLATLFIAQCQNIRARGDSPQIVVFLAPAYTLEVERQPAEDLDETVAPFQAKGIAKHPDRVEILQVQVFWRDGEAWFHREVSRAPGCPPALVGPWQNVTVNTIQKRSRFGDAVRPVLDSVN